MTANSAWDPHVSLFFSSPIHLSSSFPSSLTPSLLCIIRVTKPAGWSGAAMGGVGRPATARRSGGCATPRDPQGWPTGAMATGAGARDTGGGGRAEAAAPWRASSSVKKR
ncbi:Os01g0644400 [Oryza sativa Japonica Group]|uniref:Os01g0644400 protein n=1 Tax=Oryza sativa subsp. japonica TaxID=39947 RepID=A0A0P0V5T5_ORYSJ|nr:hypothetical protein EE612_004634 [Oryza sativa]BAS73391.1 Os01g0644400 [Oryza sativa Japonica Group]